MNTAEFLTISAAIVPEREALVCGDVRLTYLQVQERVKRLAKAAVTQGLDLPLAEGLNLEARLARQALASRDARKGLRALREGLTPQFGRA